MLVLAAQQQNSSTRILQQNLGRSHSVRASGPGKLFRRRQSLPEQCGKEMLNDHQHEAWREKASHFSPASLDDIERRPMFVYTPHLVQLLASTL
jgi:hypothetical protein